MPRIQELWCLSSIFELNVPVVHVLFLQSAARIISTQRSLFIISTPCRSGFCLEAQCNAAVCEVTISSSGHEAFVGEFLRVHFCREYQAIASYP
jgi:hypothetical protein